MLGRTHTFPFDRPGKYRRRLSSAEQVTAAFPAVRLVVEAKEQRVQRPGGAYEVQRPFYSGERTCHTAETQFAVAPDGRIESVNESHPGGATHDATLLTRTKLLDRLAHTAGEAAMVDKGSVPVKKHLAGRPLVIPTKGTRNHPLTDGQRPANQMIAKHRIVVEHTIAQVNRFTVPAAAVSPPGRPPPGAAQAGHAGGGRAGEPAELAHGTQPSGAVAKNRGRNNLPV